MNSSPFCPTEIRFIEKAHIEQEILQIRGMHILLILSETSAKRWDFLDLVEKLRENNYIIWNNKITGNPTQKDIIDCWEKIKNQKIDLIIAVGGGSAIDLAKAISALYKPKSSIPTLEQLTEIIKNKSYQNRTDYIDIIAMPTTAGTGSELTQWATIWDIGGKEKYSIDSPSLAPIKAFIVPELTLTLPKELSLSTGLDALSHAIEAYWSRNTNHLVQDIAFRSIEIILEYMSLMLSELDNLSYREKICRASVLAGLAFSHTRTTASHSISYPMTLQHNVPHGIAVAITLGEVSKRNQGKFPNDIELYNLFARYGGLQNWLDSISEGILKLRLSYFDILDTDIDSLANNAFTSGRMDNNPVIFTEEEVKSILKSIY